MSVPRKCLRGSGLTCSVHTLVPLAMHLSAEVSILGGLTQGGCLAGKMFPGLGSEQSQISGWESSEHGGTDGE